MAVTAAELLVKIQTAGADELAKVATAVQSVGEGTRLTGAQLKTFDATLNSLVATGKTYTESLKEMAASQGVLSSSVVSTSKALLAHMGIVEETTGKTHAMVGANIAAGAAIRDLTGQANIRAVENLLSNVLGLGSAFQMIFPIVGAIAAIEEINKMRERFDPLVEATKQLAEENKKLDQTYVNATANIARYIEQQARATLGASAARAFAAYDSGTQHLEAEFGLKEIQRQIADKQKSLYTVIPGANNPEGGVYNLPDTKVLVPAVEAEIKTLEAKAEGYQVLIREFDARKKAEEAQQAHDKKREDKEAGRPAAELKKRQDEELLRIQKELETLQAKELFGEDKIRATRDAIIKQLQAEHLIRTDGLAVERQITEELVKQFHHKMDLAGDTIDLTFDENQSKYRDRRAKDALIDLRTHTPDVSAYNRDANAIRKIDSRGDEAEDQRIRREAVEPNPRAKKDRTDDSVLRELRNYEAQLAASDKILANDTKRLDIAKLDAQLAKARADVEFHLSEQEWADEEKLADARRKHADEIYTLEQQHRAALAAEQQADLEKYQSLAGRVFDALIDHRRNGLGELIKDEAIKSVRQVAVNVVAPALQSAGHSLAGLTGGHLMPGLQGTFLDPKNGSIDVARETANHTKTTAEATTGILDFISGRSSAFAPGGTAGGGGTVPGLAAFFRSASTFLHAGSRAPNEEWMPHQDYVSEWAPTQHYDSGFSVNNGSESLPGGTPDGTTVAPHMSIGSMAATAAQIAGGALAVRAGIQKGGVAGGLEAAGGAAATAGAAISAVAKLAGALSPALAAAGPIGALVGAGLGILTSLLPNRKEQRAQEISDELRNNQYMAPTALNVTQALGGGFADFDSHGLLRTSTLNAYPTVADPYQTARRIDGQLQYGDAPGSVQKPYTGSASGSGQTPQSNAGPTYIFNGPVHAMDSKSFHQYLQENHHALGEGIATHLQSHEGRASQEIRFVTNTEK